MAQVDLHPEAPSLARSASVREPVKSHPPHLAGPGGSSPKQHGHVDRGGHGSSPTGRPPRDSKRRTVQLEYVAPASETARGQSQTAVEPAANPIRTELPTSSSSSRSRPHPVDPEQQLVSSDSAGPSKTAMPLPEPTTTNQLVAARSRAPPTTSGTAPVTRPSREPPRSVSDSTGGLGGGQYIARPNTGGSLASTGSRSVSTRLPSRGSYSRPGQPSAPAVATTNAQGRLAQPTNGKPYVISNPISRPDGLGDDDDDAQRRVNPSTGGAHEPPPAPYPGRAHKRSNTVGGIGEKIFGRSGSRFGRSQATPGRRSSKGYPPTSMQAVTGTSAMTPRPSVDSRRSASYGVGGSGTDKPKRFSFLPTSFSLKHLSGGGGTTGPGRDQHPPPTSLSTMGPADLGAQGSARPSRPIRPIMAFGRGLSQSTDDGLTGHRRFDESFAFGVPTRARPTGGPTATAVAATTTTTTGRTGGQAQTRTYEDTRSTPTTGSNSSVPPDAPLPSSAHPAGDDDVTEADMRGTGSSWPQQPSRMHKPARKFIDAYEPPAPEVPNNRGGKGSGSSSAARRVMDLFRRRGKSRTWDDR